MPALNLYIETSVFGFYYDDQAANQEKRAATRELFERLRSGTLRGYLSTVTLRELEATGDAAMRKKLLELVEPLEPLTWEEEQNHAILELADRYVRGGAVPPAKMDDALHVAASVVTRQVDALVSWNYRHLANVQAKRRLRALTLEAGYDMTFEIVTPWEVLGDESP